MLYDEYTRIWDEAAVDEFISLHHEEYHITSHSKNSVTKFSDINTDQLADWMIASEFEGRRLIYEHGDIIICCNIATFSNGRTEAVLKSHLKNTGCCGERKQGRHYYVESADHTFIVFLALMMIVRHKKFETS